MENVDYVMHVASPFPSKNPKEEDEVLKPAIEGTLRICRAAEKAKVKRLIVTSSIAAVFSGRFDIEEFDESHWGDPNRCSVYEKSKILAEKGLWQFRNDMLSRSGWKMEICCINPGLVIGPSVNDSQSTSVDTILRPMNDQLPGVPNLSFSIVDVRDVALAHI